MNNPIVTALTFICGMILLNTLALVCGQRGSTATHRVARRVGLLGLVSIPLAGGGVLLSAISGFAGGGAGFSGVVGLLGSILAIFSTFSSALVLCGLVLQARRQRK